MASGIAFVESVRIAARESSKDRARELFPAFGNQPTDKNAQQMLAYSANLTDTQKVIAEYWKDGPRSELPPGG